MIAQEREKQQKRDNELRVLLVTDTIHPDVNGVARNISQLQNYAVRSNFELDLISQYAFPTVNLPGYREIRVGVCSTKQIVREIERSNPDWIHITTEGPVGFAARSACIELGIKFSTSYLTNFELYAACRVRCSDVFVRRYIKYFHSQSACVIVPALSALKKLVGFGIRNGKVLPLGVDLNLFSPAKRNPAVFGNLPKPIFLYVGRVSVEKNLEAFLSLPLPGTKVVVGDGPMKKRLEKKYREARFLGYMYGTELAEAYASSDVLVFPSKTDTFGLVQLEALASGVPVAAFPVAGPADVIGSSDSGILDDDLEIAALKALHVSRDRCRTHAEQFSDTYSARLFFECLYRAKHKIPN